MNHKEYIAKYECPHGHWDYATKKYINESKYLKVTGEHSGVCPECRYRYIVNLIPMSGNGILVKFTRHDPVDRSRDIR